MSIHAKPATTDADLHQLIANRWSPRSFDSSHLISESEMNSILEAARWAPSWKNAQPWRFLIGLRGDKNFNAIVSTLMDSNLEWAPKTSALILVSAQSENVSNVEIFDSALAVGNLTLQAHSMGLATHQMGGFSKAKIKSAFNLPSNIEPVVLVGIGKIADPQLLSPALQEKELAPRSRISLSELIIKGLN